MFDLGYLTMTVSDSYRSAEPLTAVSVALCGSLCLCGKDVNEQNQAKPAHHFFPLIANAAPARIRARPASSRQVGSSLR